MRFAQEALGDNSKAVHSAYASKAEVTVPSPEMWEKQMKDKIVDMKVGKTAASSLPVDGDDSATPLVIARP